MVFVQPLQVQPAQDCLGEERVRHDKVCHIPCLLYSLSFPKKISLALSDGHGFLVHHHVTILWRLQRFDPQTLTYLQTMTVLSKTGRKQ